MTDTTVVSTLTNNSVSFDISGLRHFEEGDKIWFCLVDIGRMLEMDDSAVRQMKSRGWFDSDEMTTVTNCHAGSDITYVSESALYRIINRSNSPKARPFERWVTKEVLPSIRKTGSYSITKSPIERILANSVDQLMGLTGTSSRKIDLKKFQRLNICKRKGEVNSPPYLYDDK